LAPRLRHGERSFALFHLKKDMEGAPPLGAPQPPSAQNADAVSPSGKGTNTDRGGAKTALRFGSPRRRLRLAHPGLGRRQGCSSSCNPNPTEKGAKMNNPKLSKAELRRQFFASENWYRHGLVHSIVFTDGAKYVADQGGAYWLLDEIALAQRYEKAVAAEPFQVWKLTVDLDRHTGTLTCEDGNGHAVFKKAIPFTDFPADEISLWFTNNTIYLPSEH
jgi:hypothetical protein